MSAPKNTGSKITVRRVEQGNRQGGCNPRGVQIQFKETPNSRGNPNMEHLRVLLEGKGYEVTEGVGVENTPFLCLCVLKGKGQIQRGEVLAVLGEDPEIDLPAVDQPEGTPGE